ncbi:DNA polymerase [Ruegeria phage DSS3-P1]|uniref:DNA polymerase n=1 Tax=Ruegeria phage DSS3-P1 TaxID=1555208 RepID=UPI00051A964B|nr:DNA polymerase [Ruegeria phage DSS3-P1]AIT13308.1 DNA polymerase [Ruegeria phage DSS3-P1]
MSFPFGWQHFQASDAEPVTGQFAAYLGKLALAGKAPPHRPIFHLDYETYSECDLPKSGASRYARDPSTEVLMLAYGWSTGEIKQWVPARGEPMPDDLRAALLDPSVTLAAWNAPFEMAITEHVLGLKIPVERWMDVMALAYSLSLPGKLEKCGEVVGLGEEQRKMARGKLLVRKFCAPRKPTKNKPWTRSDHETDPEDWQEFLEYNIRDVEAERAIYKRLKKFQMPDHEWKLWHLDQKINNAGIPINLKAVKAAVRLAEATIEHDLKEMRRLTGLHNPNSNAQILPWLRDHGYNFLDLKKGHVERAAKAARERVDAVKASIDLFPAPLQVYLRRTMVEPDELLSRVLDLRLRVSKASVKKFTALLAATDEDGMLRGCHQFAGAGRTWRWSGRRFQPQNLPKPDKSLEDRVAECVYDIEHLSIEEIWAKYENPMEVLTAAVRPVVQSGPGKLLVDADLSAIENVVLGWLAGDEKILRVFREGLDPYIDFATDMFGMSYADIEAEVKAGNKSKRTTAKPGVLGCGYMLGAGEQRENHQTGEIEATGLLGYAWAMYVPLTPEMAKLSVDTFRAKFEDVVKFWYDQDAAVRRVIKTHKSERVGYLTIDFKKPFLRIGLPSGRFLHYMRPKIQDRRMPWKDKNGNAVIKPQITYENLENGQWRRVTTHPGKLTENVTQAVARDILANGMTLADEAGLDLRMHVHDQAVALSMAYRAVADLGTLIRCLTTRPTWADDKLPLKAAGLVTPIFIKD